MKRHYSNYFKGIPHFKDYRKKLVTSNDKDQIFSTLKEIEIEFNGFVF